MEDCNPNNQQSGKVNFDPGWNDPPTFSYNAQQTTPNRPRNFLNKRVAFPMSGSGGANPSLAATNLPPMHVHFPPAPPVHSNPKLVQQDEEVVIDSESALLEVTDTLTSILECSSELDPKANDIKRRIKMMKDMWTSGKLNKRIHFQMKELANALKEDQPSKADDIHRALMVDHVNAVGSWMPGIKQLIYNCIARSELLSLDKE